jgi:hypothetical protein
VARESICCVWIVHRDHCRLCRWSFGRSNGVGIQLGRSAVCGCFFRRGGSN